MDNAEIFARADEAGRAAAAARAVRPMVVIGGEERYYVPDGVCGFAWVVVPGNSSFGKYLKRERGARKGYPSGIHLWVSDYNQSMERKEAYAYGFANVLNEAGISAYAGSRMD